AAGTVRILDVDKIPRGESKVGEDDEEVASANGAVLGTLRGSRADGRLGGAVLSWTSLGNPNGTFLISEALVDGERGRAYVIPNHELLQQGQDKPMGDWFHYLSQHVSSPSSAAKARCLIGPQARSRLGTAMLLADLDADGSLDLVVSAGGDGESGKEGVRLGGAGFVRILWAA
ncbi:hypothetical protein HDU96_000882, partial [Phlyctochytrium bullatum]